jgi:hypothetical protein
MNTPVYPVIMVHRDMKSPELDVFFGTGLSTEWHPEYHD